MGPALLDVNVTYGTDVDDAQQVIKAEADALWRDSTWRGKVLEEPEVWGIEELGPDGIVIRLVIKTQPAAQFGVMRELRRRITDAFYREGIEVPSTQRSMWVRRDAGSSREQVGDLVDVDGDGEPDFRLASVHEKSAADRRLRTPPPDDEDDGPHLHEPRPKP